MKKILLLLVAVFATFGVRAADPADVKVLLDTDFTVFTDGTEASPKSLYSSDFNKLATGYYLVTNVASAGGKLLIKQNGYIQTNTFSDLPTAGGTVRITAEVMMINYSGGFQYQPGYTTADYVTEYVEKENEWTKVVTYVGNVKSSTRIKLIPFLSVEGFYIKSLKIEYSADFIASPQAYLPADADGTQFTAACSTNAQASKYEADVFSYDKDGKEVYFAKDVELKKLSAYSSYASAKVTGLDANTTYWYVARCVTADGAKSDNSEPVKVVKKLASISAPKALAATDVTATGFTANWEAVAEAESYLVNVYSKTTLTKEEAVSVFSEDFSGVKIGTPTSLEYTGDLNDFTSTKGWTTDFSKAYASGYFVFYPTSASGELITPAIDLSSEGGKFQFSIKAAVRDYTGVIASTDTLKVALLDNAGNVLEEAPYKILSVADYSNYTFDFTKGAKDSKLRITFIKADSSAFNKLFVDELNVTQTLPAGSVVEKQIASLPAEGTSLKVEQALEEGTGYYYTVVALGETVVGTLPNTSLGLLESDESNQIVVELKTSGVEEVVASAPKAWKSAAGELTVTGCNVVVADLAGTVLLRNVSEVEQTYTVNHKGIVVVLVDGKSYKFAL